MKASIRHNTDYSGLYRLIAVCCGILTALPYTRLLIVSYFYPSHPWLCAMLLSCAAIWLGYGVQALCGLVTGGRGKECESDQTYEGLYRYYSLKKAAVPNLCAVILMFVIRSFVLHFWAGTAIVPTAQSLVPWLCGAIIGVLFAFGASMWFLPVSRLISLTRCLLMGLAFFLAQLLSPGDSSVAICFALCAVLMLVLLNQSYITRSYRGTIVSAINDSAKGFNTVLVLIMALAMGAAAALFSVALIGVANLVWIVVAFFVIRSHSGDPNYLDEHASELHATQNLSGQLNINTGFISGATYFLLLLGLIIVIGIILSRSGQLRRFFDALINGLHSLMAWLRNLRNRKTKKAEAVHININYEDTVEKIVPEKQAFVSEKTIFTYQDFLRRINHIREPKKQLYYAYGALAKRFAHMDHTGVRPSDTPREMNQKLHRKAGITAFDHITTAFEQLQYADQPPSNAETQQLLDQLCKLAREYIF